MDAWSIFDLPYLFRQAFLLSVMCAWPLFVYAAISGQRGMLLVWTSSLLMLGWSVLILLLLRTNLRIWDDGIMPYTPFRVGPSMHSLRDMVPWLGCFIWVPSLLVYVLMRLVLRRRNRGHLLPRATFIFIAFCALAGMSWGWFGVAAIEYAHEDTVWAKGFSFAGWQKVSTGMTQDQVTALLGDPLPEPIKWGYAEGKEQMQRLWWVRNWSAGYFAVVWFDKGLVHQKQFWFSD